MFKNVLKWNFLFILAIAAFGTACEKNLTDDLNEATDLTIETRSDPYEGTRGPGGRLLHGCFEFVFPVTVALPGGETAEANDPAELRQIFREWCQSNPGTSRPTVVMPFEVSIEDDTTVLIETAEDFQAVVADCLPDSPPFPRPHRKCFRPVFPVTLVFPDGNTLEVENSFQLRMAIRDWKENNPDATEHPTIQFPYDVTLQDGTVVTVNSEEDVQTLLEECTPDGPNGPCFQPEYPLTVIYPDGTTVEVNNRQELRVAIREWFVNNPDSEERPELEYPFDVTLADGTVVTVESADQLQEIWADCGHNGPHRPCFRPVFPLTIDFPDGTSTTVENRFEFRMAVRAWIMENPDAEERPSIAFPYDVILADGTVMTLEDQAALDALIESCGEE